MPRNGSGSYSLPAGNPVVTGTTISSTVHNNTMSDVATALTGSLSADGQTPPTANLPMSNYRHTGVGDATALDQYASAKQVQNGTLQLLTSVSGTNTITASTSPAATAYATGQAFRFVSAGANTGAVTLNINGLGAKSVTKNGTNPLISGDIPSGAVCEVVYDGTQFQLRGVVEDRLPKAGGTMTGALNMSGAPINEARGADIASASTINLTTATGNLVDVTGTTTITAITLAEGAERTVRFTGILTLTNGASLVLPSGANITTAAGDFAKFRGYAAGVVRCVSYSRANGQALASPDQLSTATGTAPSYSARAWVNFNGTGTVAIKASANVSSITDNGVGDYTVNFTTAMTDANYAIAIGVNGGSAPTTLTLVSAGAGTAPTLKSTTQARFKAEATDTGTDTDINDISVTFFR